MKRVSMAGSDVAVTDGALADLLLDYAKELGRVGTTDTVVLPVAQAGHASEASLLLGPASQIALTENDDMALESVQLDVAAVCADIEERRRALTEPHVTTTPSEPDETVSFTEFGEY